MPLTLTMLDKEDDETLISTSNGNTTRAKMRISLQVDEEDDATSLSLYDNDSIHPPAATSVSISGFLISPTGSTSSVDSCSPSSPSSAVTALATSRQHVHHQEVSASDLIKLSDLGAGVNGTVTKCLNIKSLELVAVKLLSIADPVQRLQLVQELATFNLHPHPYILNFKGACLDNSMCALLLELCDASLESLCHKQGPLRDEVQLRVIVRQITQGLAHLASNRKIHRDLKPANVLLVSHEHHFESKIADFGLVRQLDCTAGLAQTFAGTLSYLSPERLRGEKYSSKADVYALGKMIVNLVVGDVHGKKVEFFALLSQVESESNASKIADLVSAECSDFVARCLQIDPVDRWSAKQLLDHPFLLQADGDESSLMDGCQKPGSWRLRAAKSRVNNAELQLIAAAFVSRYGDISTSEAYREKVALLASSCRLPIEAVTEALKEVKAAAPQPAVPHPTSQQTPSSNKALSMKSSDNALSMSGKIMEAMRAAQTAKEQEAQALDGVSNLSISTKRSI